MDDKLRESSGKEGRPARVIDLPRKSEQSKAPAWLRRVRTIQAEEQSRQQ